MWRILIVAGAGMGMAVAAQQIARVALERAADRQVLAQAEPDAGGPDGSAPEPGAPPAGPATREDPVEQMSEAEIQAEMARIENEAGATEPLEEFEPSRPLAADIAIALPSDI